MFRALRALRDWLSDLYQVLSPCRYSVIILLIGGFSFLLVPQGQDVLRRMVEWGDSMGARGGPGTEEILGRLVIFFAAVVIWALSTWYWARVILYLRQPEGPPDNLRQARMRTWVPRILGTLALLIMAVALWSAAQSYLKFRGEGPPARLHILAAICLVLAVLFVGFVSKRRDLIRVVRGRQGGHQAGHQAGEPAVIPPEVQFANRWDLPPGTRRAALVSLVVSLILGLLFTFQPIFWGRLLGTLPIVLLTAANWVLFGTALLYLSRRARVPLLILLLLLGVVFSRWNDNHAIRLWEKRPFQPLNGSIADQFHTWKGNVPNRPIFIVAAEGGGIRAAYWAAIVLGKLHDTYPGFSPQVFAISGVSGGSLGGAVFTALLAEEQAARAKGQSLPCGTVRACAGQVLENDFLSPTLAKMIAPDLSQRFFFLPVPLADRARTLEDSWADSWRDVVKTDRFNEPFLSLWKGGAATTLPSLVLNGTHVETGRRIVTTNLKWNATEFHDTYNLLNVLCSDVLLKTAAHNSARFTYISPAGTMRPRQNKECQRPEKASQDDRARGHVVDGGYFENSGTATAMELVAAVSKACNHTCEDRIYVIYLRNSPETNPLVPTRPAHPEETDQKKLEPYTNSYPRLNELLSPPRALLNTREGRGSLAVEAIRDAITPGHFLQFGLCERVADPSDPKQTKRAPLPLGWQLSETARQTMENQLDNPCRMADNPGTAKRIGEILSGPPTPPEAPPAR